MEIAIDFDGTIVEHDYPRVGAPVPNALEVIRKLQMNNHNIILWTMRSNNNKSQTLDDAVNYLINNGIKLYGINENPDQRSWSTSPKAYAQLCIDDINAMTPLVQIAGKRPYVDWFAIEKWLRARGVI
jgi:trehalose-6-phosphatase